MSIRLRAKEIKNTEQTHTQEVAVDAKTTALLVLDLNARCDNPEEACHKLIEPVAKFLERARQANMFIMYTAADRYKGTPEARMPAARSSSAPTNRRSFLRPSTSFTAARCSQCSSSAASKR